METHGLPNEFSLALTLSCGQCFRWSCDDGLWNGVARGMALSVCDDDVSSLACDPVLSEYFDLEFDYASVRDELSRLSPVLARAAAFSAGIHILNQDPWETLCSFIISQNNNIPRIKGIVGRLCERFGAACGSARGAVQPCHDVPARDFPAPETLAEAGEAELRALGCGFRAPYIVDAALAVSRGNVPLESLRTLPLAEAREALMTVKGVGPKVADCTLLYGLHRLDAFPADVWIKRAMTELFPGKTSEFFGEHAGIAQQYIFHYIRCAGA